MNPESAFPELEAQKREVILDISQLILDITGIFEPTPFSDGTNALISLVRGKWVDAAISAVSIIPYLGDLSKVSKLPKHLETIRRAIKIAKKDARWSNKLRVLFVKLKKVLDDFAKYGSDQLPDGAKKILKAMQEEIDRFLWPQGKAVHKAEVARPQVERASQRPPQKPKGSVSEKTGKNVPQKVPKFKNLQEMDGRYVGEETGAIWGNKVAYLGTLERQEYKLSIKNGKLYDAEGNLFDTAEARSAFGGEGNAIFVMDEYGSIYASTYHSPGRFHHSSFLSGKPVASAGEIVVDNGILKSVTRRSGHYKPTAEQTEQFLQSLNKSGVDLNNVSVGGGF